MTVTVKRPLEGRAALVTGASRGIGKAIARRLGHEGASVAVNYVNDEQGAVAVVAAIEDAGGRAVSIQADLSDAGSVVGLCDKVRKSFGHWDILVNNAGTATFGELTGITVEDYDRMFNLNVKAPYLLSREAALYLQDGGRIINISSGITISGSAGGAIYAGSKGALEQLTLCAAKELAKRNITVNTVSPGMTETDLLVSVFGGRAPLDAAAKAHPFGRLGVPDDIANVVAFLVGPDGGWISGQNIRASGGSS